MQGLHRDGAKRKGSISVFGNFSYVPDWSKAGVWYLKLTSEFADGTAEVIFLFVCFFFLNLNPMPWELNWFKLYVPVSIFHECFLQISLIHVVELFGFIWVHLVNVLSCQCEILGLESFWRIRVVL